LIISTVPILKKNTASFHLFDVQFWNKQLLIKKFKELSIEFIPPPEASVDVQSSDPVVFCNMKMFFTKMAFSCFAITILFLSS